MPSARWNWEEKQPRVQSVLAHFINKEGWYGSVLTLVVSYNLVTNRVSGIKKTKTKTTTRPPQHVSILKGEKSKQETQGS